MTSAIFLVCINRKESGVFIVIFLLSDVSVDNSCLPKNGENRNPCKNGGKCEFTNGEVKCVCPIQYEGPTCAGKNLQNNISFFVFVVVVLLCLVFSLDSPKLSERRKV